MTQPHARERPAVDYDRLKRMGPRTTPDRTAQEVAWPRGVDAQVMAEAGRAYPEECCGLLLGTPEGETRAAAPLTNAEQAERRRVSYLLAPGEYRRTEQQAREHGLDVVGVYHSHPDHPAVPSASDVAEAWPGWLYVIVPVDQGVPGDARGWRLRTDRSGFDPVVLVHIT